ncbi:hypothetical protein [Mesorhizobium sp. GR13]|uniref:hypothetical protein n=1 Tax=Mesorhizobium sp. GR13 TaxID=2562308 RepID=UPI0010C0C7CF|nr:hypothetical protein [Mesorhizobium sp. GR13]
MSRLNDPQNFRGRVAYAAQVIARGGGHTRAFDNCFENDDGDEVAVAILRRSGRNPKLAANLTRYLDVALVKECDQQLALIPTRKLRIAAAATRARRTAAQAQPEEK